MLLKENSNILGSMETMDLNTFINQRWFYKNNLFKGMSFINLIYQMNMPLCIRFYLDSGKRVLYGYPMVKNRVDLD